MSYKNGRPNWFVAVPVMAGKWFTSLQENRPDLCRGFDPLDLHMTLAFLGAMDPQKEEAVIKTMAQIQYSPFEFTFSGVLALPNAKRCSALALSFGEGQTEASNLIAQWRGPLIETAEARPDDRPPLPHVTIARPIRKHGATAREAALNWAEKLQPPTCRFNAESIALYTWSEDRSRNLFRMVHQQPLG